MTLLTILVVNFFFIMGFTIFSTIWTIAKINYPYLKVPVSAQLTILVFGLAAVINTLLTLEVLP